MIVNSHYVPLQEPYPIIYCRGEVGIQIGTLIVVEGRDPSAPHAGGRREPSYAIRTHSHPVVSYGNKKDAQMSGFLMPNDWSEGIVWDKAELRSVTVLCHSDNPVIPESRFSHMVYQERYDDFLSNTSTFKLSPLMFQFRRLKVRLEIPIPDGDLKVKLVFRKSPIGSNLLDVMKMGEEFMAPYLHILVRASENMDMMEQNLREQIDDYRAALAPNQVQFTFDSIPEEWKPLAERLNKVYSQL